MVIAEERIPEVYWLPQPPKLNRQAILGELEQDFRDATESARKRLGEDLLIDSEDLTITGNVTSKGKLHLDGRIQGDVHCTVLVLGENAQLEGRMIAEEVKVCGRLIGSVHALRVTLQSTSHVEA